MASEIIAGLGALKTAFDIAKGLKDIDDAARRNSAVIELQEKILHAQEIQAVMAEQVGSLESKLEAFERWELERKRYRLKDFGGNTFAYELMETEAQGEPIHRICPNCFEKRQRSILQFIFRTRHLQDRYKCPSCSTDYDFGVPQSAPTPPLGARRRVF